MPHRQDAWDVPEPYRRRMVEAARELRQRETPSEKRLWAALRRKSFAGIKVRRQQPIGPFVVDFFIPRFRLIVEIDGPVHESQQPRDHERQEILEGLGLRVIRCAAAEVDGDLATVLRRISQALAE